MTKTEQKLLDRVRQANDHGKTCYDPVSRTQGQKLSWRRGGGRESGHINKLEEKAWERIVERGDVIKCPRGGGYAIPGHPFLADVAADICLMRRAREVETARIALEQSEKFYADDVAFVNRWGAL